MVQNVQPLRSVQAVQTPSPDQVRGRLFILPRVAGEDRGGGLNGAERLNGLNDLNCLNGAQRLNG